MPELIAKSALDGKRLTLGTITLTEVSVGPITGIALFPGGDQALAQGLKTLGLAMPAANRVVEKDGVRLVWAGKEQAFLIGRLPPVLEGAAVTDQSDGWTVLSLAGVGAEAVLARLVPVDLRLAAFAGGHVLRTQVNHMNAVILRVGETAFQILVFRSMARTAWHELEATMHMVAARSEAKI